MVQVLRQCGDDVSRDKVMPQAANLKNFRLDLLLPGLAINTSPSN
jgi:branched-chain amino acid transport system substrate-binding protein